MWVNIQNFWLKDISHSSAFPAKWPKAMMNVSHVFSHHKMTENDTDNIIWDSMVMFLCVHPYFESTIHKHFWN